MISAKEFDKKFDNNEDIEEYIDFNTPLTNKDLKILIQKSVTIKLSDVLKEKLIKKSKELGLSLEDTIKVLLAKEVGVI